MTGAALVGAAPVATRRAGPEERRRHRLAGPRRFAADAGAAVRTADRHGIAVRVVAAHLEGLARVRAELGHEAADGVLRTLALRSREVLRVGDVAYRIGEDERALLLPATGDTSACPAVAVGGRLADVLTAVALPGPARRLGLRTAPVPLDTVHEGMDAVDAALGAVGVTPPGCAGRWVESGLTRGAAAPRHAPEPPAAAPAVRHREQQRAALHRLEQRLRGCRGLGPGASDPAAIPAAIPASSTRAIGRRRPRAPAGSRRRPRGHPPAPRRAIRAGSPPRTPGALGGDDPVPPAQQRGRVAGGIVRQVLHRQDRSSWCPTTAWTSPALSPK